MHKYPAKFGMTSLFSSLSEEDVHQLESDKGIVLPQDYRHFLLQWNGAHFDGRQPAFPRGHPDEEEDDSMIARLFGLGGDEGDLTNDLRHAGFAQEFQSRVPQRFLAIGRNAYRQMICISVDGTDCGSVYVWSPSHDYPEYDEEEPSEHYLTLVADSFAEFFDSLYKNPDPVWW
jgi:SMI1/KNR4 family protein SUKH-1